MDASAILGRNVGTLASGFDRSQAGQGPARTGGEPSALRSGGIDFSERPILVFWETTKACELACRHCRASAVAAPMPGELSTEEALGFVESLTLFGRPFPVLIFTGGDVLLRRDLERIVAHAGQLDLPMALAPSVTPRLSAGRLVGLRELGVGIASISLDGARPETHEGIRGIRGHLEATLAALRLVRECGMKLQVNTCVMGDNVDELPELAKIVHEAAATVWEVFFLVRLGRGADLRELSPDEGEDVCHFLVEAARHGFIVRTVEAPFFRRVVAWRAADPPGADPASEYGLGPLYERLSMRLSDLLGEPAGEPRAQTKGTRDGKGIVFVSHNGDVFPAGFLPVTLGNVKTDGLVDLYRDHPLLARIRGAQFSGRCGECEYADLCGGSRARAYATSGDPLADDPACAYQPGSRPGATGQLPSRARHERVQ